MSRTRSGLAAIPPITVHLLPHRTCWGCGARAAVAIRRLSGHHHRFYCHACATTLRPPRLHAAKPRRG